MNSSKQIYIKPLPRKDKKETEVKVIKCDKSLEEWMIWAEEKSREVAIKNDNKFETNPDEKGWKFMVKSTKDQSKVYTIDLIQNTCTCPHHIYRKVVCKHLVHVKKAFDNLLE